MEPNDRRPLDADERALLGDVERFNATLGRSGWRLADARVQNVEAEGLRMAQPDIRRVDWENVVIRDAVIRGGVFEEVRFAGATFIRTTFVGTRFADCTFDHVIFEGVIFEDATFEGCTLDGTRFKDSRLEDVRLVDIRDERSVFEGSTLRRVSVTGSTLTHTMIYTGELEDFDVRNSTLRSVKISGMQTQGVEMESTTLEYVSFVKGTHGRLAFQGCRGQDGVSFMQAEIDELHFASCDGMARIVLNNTQCNRFVLQDSQNIDNPVFLESTVGTLTIEGSRLATVDIEDTEISGPSVIRRSVFDGLNFRGSHVTGLTMEQSTIDSYLVLTDARFERLTLQDITYGRPLRSGAEGVEYVESDTFLTR